MEQGLSSLSLIIELKAVAIFGSGITPSSEHQSKTMFRQLLDHEHLNMNMTFRSFTKLS